MCFKSPGDLEQLCRTKALSRPKKFVRSNALTITTELAGKLPFTTKRKEHSGYLYKTAESFHSLQIVLFVVAENIETGDAHEPYFVLKFSLQRSQNFDSHTFDAAITHFDRLCERDTCQSRKPEMILIGP